MLIYVIEDDGLKASRLVELIDIVIPDAKATVLGSYHSGLRMIETTRPDLVLLDMTLPTFDRAPGRREGRLRPLGGYDLLRKLRRQDIQTKVIVVTQLDRFGDGDDEVTFSEISEKCDREFPGVFVGSIYYQQTSTEWRHKLTMLISKLIPGDAQ